MIVRRALLILVIFLFSVGAGWGGRGVSFSEQWPLFEALRTTAAIVFGVMGAWLALLYPRALQSVVTHRNLASSDEEEQVRALLLPIKLSTGVLIAVLFIGPFASWAKHLSIIAPYLDFARAFSFGTLVFLTIAEMLAVILTLWPVDAARGEIEKIRQKKKRENSLFKLVQKR